MQFRLGHVDSYIRAGSSFYYCICTASHTAQWSNYVYYTAEALQRAFRQAGGERPARRNSRQHWKMGSLSSFCCVKGTPRQDEGDCGRLSGFVDSLWLLLPSFFFSFLFSTTSRWRRISHLKSICFLRFLLSWTFFAGSIETCDFYTHTQYTHSACVVTDYYYYQAVSGQKAKTL